MNITHKIHHDENRQRFDMPLDDGSVAFLSYRLDGNTADYEHTRVPEQFKGQGLAAELTRFALNEARDRQWKVLPSCSYVAVFIRRNPEFADLLVA